MSVTWATLKAQLQRKLDDNSGRKYDSDLLMDAVNDALAAFAATHTGVLSDFEITGDGLSKTWDLPDDIVDEEGAKVVAVHWKQNQWLTALEYWPGESWHSASVTTSSRPLGYVVYGTEIRFSRIPSDGQAVTVHYVAHYPEVEDDDSAITVPRWAREAIKCYAAAVALEPASVKASNLGQYKDRTESGSPEDNPMYKQAEYFMRRYDYILSKHQPPQYDRLFPIVRDTG
jgi:hypothetical protein